MGDKIKIGDDKMLKLGNSYLGYTDNKTPLQKARIEGILDKKKRFNQVGIVSMKQMIFDLITEEGRTTEKEENYQYYKRDGELTKPKTVYRLIKDNIYMELNKTEYDFANYIIENNFTKEKAANYIAEEIAEVQRQRELEAGKKMREQYEKEQREKQEKKFKEWLQDQVENYPKNEKYNIAKDIFIDEIEIFQDRQIELLVLIDNFDNPQCKEKLSDRLSYRNVASLKTFYHITGVRLGRTNKAIEEKLNNITSKDFTGIVKYKKKPIPEGHKKFYKIMGDKSFVEAYGEHIELKGFDLYLTTNQGLYTLTEGRTGVIITQGYSRDEAIEKFNKVIEDNADMIKKSIKELIDQNGLSPIYEIGA